MESAYKRQCAAGALTAQGNEVWVVRTAGDGTVIDRQLVGEGCAEDTPYGVACDGLSMVRVQPPTTATPNTVTVAWEGPGPGCGGWTRASGDIEVSLDSFRTLRRNEWSGRAREPDDSQTIHWDFIDWSFRSEWQTSAGDCGIRKRGPALGIPKLKLGSAFLGGAWQQASLNQCASTIDSSRGVVLPGTTKSIAVLRAVVSETDALFVDVSEAPHSKPGGELQICSAEWNAHSYDYCHIPVKPDCVRLALDGHVRSGKAAVERASDRPRFRVQLSPETTALSVSLIEAGGRTISSSVYLRGDATSLGSIFPLSSEVASCDLDGNDLELSPPTRQSDRALLDATGLR